MVYEKHTWSDGELITAERLNELEDRVRYVSDDLSNRDIDFNGKIYFKNVPNYGGLQFKMTSLGLSKNDPDTPSEHYLNHLKNSKADVSFCPLVYIDDNTSSSFTMQSDERINNFINSVNATGRSVKMLKPHIGTPIAGDSFDRANYKPDNYTYFFDNWTNVLLHYAEIAKNNNIPILCIGVEQYQNTNNDYASGWEKLVTTIKLSYPDLYLTYAMNTTEELSPDTNWEFIKYLDFAGLNVYPKYTSDPDYTKTNADILAHAWYGTNHFTQINYADIVENIWQRFGKQVIITETGLRSSNDGLVWMLSNLKNPVYGNFEVTKLAIQTIRKITNKEKRVIGVAWWSFGGDFGTIPLDDNDEKLTVAEVEMNDWYGE